MFSWIVDDGAWHKFVDHVKQQGYDDYNFNRQEFVLEFNAVCDKWKIIHRRFDYENKFVVDFESSDAFICWYLTWC